MGTTFKVLISAPKSKNLSKEQDRFLDALRERVSGSGLDIAQLDPAAPLEDQARFIASLQGVIVVAFAQWSGERLWRKGERATLATEFNHVTIALANSSRRPLLVLREKSVTARGALLPRLAPGCVKVPAHLDTRWLIENEFRGPFTAWLDQVNQQRHVFFGYSSRARAAANALTLWLAKRGVKVLDWHDDFRPGESILSRIQGAVERVACGLFLFTADDLGEAKGRRRSRPRDDVVFEAGYFASAKGKARTLLIVEEGCELPSDLGGDIYLPLPSRTDVSPIEGRLADYFDEIL